MPAAIETLDLTRRFGERLAVDRVSMTVPEVAGESGLSTFTSPPLELTTSPLEKAGSPSL